MHTVQDCTFLKAVKAATRMSDETNCQVNCRFRYHKHRNDNRVNDCQAVFLVV